MATAAQAAAQTSARAASDARRAEVGGRTLEVTPEELLEMINQITPGQIIAFRNAVMKMAVGKMNPAQFSIYEYQGFDPRRIMLKYLAVGIYHGMKIDGIINDIMHVIAINLYMGNVASQKLERRPQAGRDKLSELVGAYNIKLGSTGTGLTPDTVTVPRTSAAFPILSTRMATILPTTETSGMPFKSENIPRCMRIASFASFLSHNIEQPTRDFLKKVVMAYSSDQSIVFSIDKKTRKPTMNPLDAYNRQLTYIQASMSSSVPEEWEKGVMLQEFGIESQYFVMEKIVTNLNKLVGLNEPVVSESDFKTHLTSYYTFCQSERTTSQAEERRIIEEERAARRRRAPPPPPIPVSPTAAMTASTAQTTQGQQTPAPTAPQPPSDHTTDEGGDNDGFDLYAA
jgi:hypothetical protein